MNKLLIPLQANTLNDTIPPKFPQKGAYSYDSITITLNSKIIFEQKKPFPLNSKFPGLEISVSTRHKPI